MSTNTFPFFNYVLNKLVIERNETKTDFSICLTLSSEGGGFSLWKTHHKSMGKGRRGKGKEDGVMTISTNI